MLRDMIFPHHAAVDLYSASIPSVQVSDYYSKDLAQDHRAHAINIISSWRLHDILPHALTATIELTGAQLFAEDIEHRQQASYEILDFKRHAFSDDLAERSTFATSFCRFVNGFVDKDVAIVASGTATPAGGGGENSMFVNAAKLGLPTSFVEFRHRCTHGRELPPLPDLKLMNGEALEWLYTTWWKTNATADSERAIVEEQEQHAETERAEELHRNLNEQRRALREQLERADGGDTTAQRPEVLVCGKDGGECHMEFLLEYDLRRHWKGFHQLVCND